MSSGPGVSRAWVAAYGALFHLGAACFFGFQAARQEGAPLGALAVPGAALVVAGVVVYATLVASYVPRRGRRKGTAAWDAAVGILAECVVVVVASLLAAVPGGVHQVVSVGLAAGLAALAEQSVANALWVFAMAATHVLVVGNAAGLLGWLLLERRCATARPRMGRE